MNDGFPLAGSTQLPVTLLFHEFMPFVQANSDLLLCYHVQLPYHFEERAIAIKSYIRSMKTIEKEYNKSHQIALDCFEKQLETNSPNLSYGEKYRAILQEESRLLDKEFVERFGKNHYGNIKLKIDKETFTKHRWLQYLLNNFVGKTNAAEQKKKILFCEDIELFKSNISVNGEGGGRSPFGVFSEKVVKYLSDQSKDILAEKMIKEEEIYLYPDRIKLLSQRDRIILLSETFLNSFTLLQHLQTASLHGMHKAWEYHNKMYRKVSARISAPTDLDSKFTEYQTKFLQIIRGEIDPISQITLSCPEKKPATKPKQQRSQTVADTPPPLLTLPRGSTPTPKVRKIRQEENGAPQSKTTSKTKRRSLSLPKPVQQPSDEERLSILDQCALTFFTEVKMVLTPLRNFLSMLLIRLEVDFTREEHERARVIKNDHSIALIENHPCDSGAKEILRITKCVKSLQVTQNIFENILTKTPSTPNQQFC